MVEVNCGHCGTAFEKKAAYVRRRHREGRPNFYCNNDCKNAAHKNRMTGEGNPNHGGTFHAEQPSDEMRKEIARKTSETMLRTGTVSGANNPRYKGELKSYECEQCGNETPPKPHYVSDRIATGKQKPFCSEECVLVYSRSRLKEIRKNGGMTSIEQRVADELESLGIEYVNEYPIGIYYADFYLPEHNLVIECDGDYWHGLPEVIERDKRKNRFYEENGIEYRRFTESQINEDIEEVAITIKYATAWKRGWKY